MVCRSTHLGSGFTLFLSEYQENASQLMHIPSRKKSIVHRSWIKILFLITITTLVYSNSLYSPFIFDDKENILNNPHIRMKELTLSSISQAALKSPSSSRPVANISFALNYYVFGYSSFGFRSINILIHITTGVLLYFLIKLILNANTSQSGRRQEWTAFFAALIWLVHPLQIQSVTYIVQRMNSMASLFFVLSLLLYGYARSTSDLTYRLPLFGSFILSSFLAFGSKQIAATLPLFILLYEWYFVQRFDRSWFRKHFPHILAILIVILIVSLIYTAGDPFSKILASYEKRDFTLVQRVLTEFRVVVHYVSLIFFPHPSRLTLDHQFELSNSLAEPATTLFSLVFILVSIAVSILWARKLPLLSFCVLWFFGNLAIESSVIGIEIIFEHRTYLPSMLLILMTVMFIDRVVPKKHLFLGTLSVVALFFSFWTYERNTVWQSRVRLWEDAVAKSPEKARPHHNLGHALAEESRLTQAISEYKTALNLDSRLVEAENNIGLALAGLGKTKEAIDHFKTAQKRFPESVEMHYNLGSIYTSLNWSDMAIRQYYKAIQVDPEAYLAHNNLGFELARTNQFAASLYHYNEAIRLNAHYADMHNNLANLLVRMGKLDAGMRYYRKALNIAPNSEKVSRNHIKSKEIKESIDRAIFDLREILTSVDRKKGVSSQEIDRLNAEMMMLKHAIAAYKDFLKMQGLFVSDFFDKENYGPIYLLKADWPTIFSAVDSLECKEVTETCLGAKDNP